MLKDFAAHFKEEHLDHPDRVIFRKIIISYKGDQEVYYSDCNT